MSEFERSELLRSLAIEHGFGTLGSEPLVPRDVCFARQVHGRALLFVPPDPGGVEADALATRQPGASVGVRTADCVPLLLADPRGRVVAAVHAGWRGSAAEIAVFTVEAIATEVGIEPASLVAAIGPHIGSCCYEVDDPVRGEIDEPEVFTAGSRSGHYQLDLGRLNRLQLERAGLPAESIENVGGCTACGVDRYASYRRDGTGARLVHWIRLPAA